LISGSSSDQLEIIVSRISLSTAEKDEISKSAPHFAPL
jgi:hypothetical protein